MQLETLDPNGLDTIPWYKQFWPWFLFGLPGIVVLACIATIIVAIRSPLSLVKDDYYKEGLAINENLAATQLASTLNLDAQLSINGQHILVDLNQNLANTNSQNWEKLDLVLIHPTDSNKDQYYKLNSVGKRRFAGLLNIQLDEIPKAIYKVRIVGEYNNKSWILNSDIDLNETESGSLLVNIKAPDIKAPNIKPTDNYD